MKRILTFLMLTVLLLGLTGSASAKPMEDGVPVWDEATVRQYALDYIEGRSMTRLWGYYDLQIRRYMPMDTYESMLVEIEWMTGDFVALGSYTYFTEPELQIKTHVLHLCMEKQDLDMYFFHKDKPDDWEVMGVEFVPAERQTVSGGQDAIVGGDGTLRASIDYSETELTVGPMNLPGILTMPNEASNENPVPACLLVHDSNQMDRDGTLGQTAMFKDLAYELAEMGVATLRYDKRAYVYGEDLSLTVNEEVIQDAIAAGQLLWDNPLVDKTRLVILGVGFGARLTPRIALESQKLFTGMILVGSTPNAYLSTLLDETYGPAQSLTADELKQLRSVANRISKMKESEAREMTIFGRNGYYYWDIDRYDVISLIRKSNMHIYIVQGKRDPIVSENQGRRLYSEGFGSKVPNSTLKAFRGLNHLLMNDLQLNINGLPEYSVPATVDKPAARNLAQWILRVNQEDEE